MSLNKTDCGNSVIYQGLLFDSETGILSIFPEGNSVNLCDFLTSGETLTKVTDFSLNNDFLTLTYTGEDGLPQTKSVFLPYSANLQYFGELPISVEGSNGRISISRASLSEDGYLASSDFTTFNSKADISSPHFTGIPTAPTALSGTNSTQIATTEFVASALLDLPPTTNASLLSSGTLSDDRLSTNVALKNVNNNFSTDQSISGNLTVSGTITNAGLTSSLNSKQSTLVSGTNIKTINGLNILGSGDIAVTTTSAWGSITGTLSDQSDLNTALGLKAPLASPSFTGTPVTPTAAIDTNTTQIASTAFVIGQGYAKLASPALTGTPTTPTAAAGTNTTQIASTAFVTTALSGKANIASPTFTGAVVLPSNTTIGSVSSAEIALLSGVSSSIQTQLNAKANLASPTFTGVVVLPSATSIGSVTSTEIGYMSGVTSAVQTQLNAKQATLVSGTSIKTINGTSLLGSGDIVISGGGSVDSVPTDGSSNAVSSDGVFDALATKQALLVSGSNIKTINGTTILGSGNIVVAATTDASALTSGTLSDARLSANVPLIGSSNSFTVGQTITSTSEQFRLRYDSSNYASFTVASSGSLTLDLVASSGTPTLTISDLTFFTGGFRTHTTSDNSNFNVITGSSSGVSGLAQIAYSGSGTTRVRVIERGFSSAIMSAGENYFSHIIGTQNVIEATSGVHPMIGSLLVKPPSMTDDATATTTDAATVVIEGIMSGVTVTGFNDAFRVVTGGVRFGSLAGVGTRYVTTDANGLLSAATIPTIDATPTNNSTNAVSSDGVFDALATKQDTLVSGTSIKTINGTSLLGSGDITIDTGSGTGDVTGAASSTDNAITRFDGTGGKTIQNSVVTISDSGAIAGIVSVNGIFPSKISILSSDWVNASSGFTFENGPSDLSFAVTSGQLYRFKFFFNYTVGSNTTGVRFSLDGPSFSKLYYQEQWNIDGVSFKYESRNSYNVGNGTTGSTTSSGFTNLGYIEGVIKPSASGTVVLRVGGEVSGDLTIISEISYVEYQRIA
jgi:hypothetical protein